MLINWLFETDGDLQRRNRRTIDPRIDCAEVDVREATTWPPGVQVEIGRLVVWMAASKARTEMSATSSAERGSVASTVLAEHRRRRTGTASFTAT
jgi:hypothetical protein